MSLLVKKKRTNILSPPEGSNSIIRRIVKTSIIQEKRQGRGTKEQKFTQDTPKKQFVYEFFFQVDMRKVIQHNIQELEYIVLSGPTVNSPGFFRGLSGISPSTITSALYSKRKENQKVIAEDMKTKFLGSGKISLVKNINDVNFNGSPGSLKNKKDSELFGKIKKNKIVDISTMKKKGKKSTRLSQVQTSTVNYGMVKNKSFYNLYREALNKHIDPGTAFSPIENMSLSTPGNTNLIVKNNLSEKDYAKSVCLNSIRAQFESVGNVPSTTVGEIYSRKSNMTSIIVEEPNRIQTISQRFKVLDDTIGARNSFIICIRVKDPKTGLLSEALNLLIPHKINVNNYYIPDDIPTITAIRSHQGPGLNTLTANFGNIGNKIYNIRISVRKINDDQSLQYSRFSKPTSPADFDPVRNQSGFKYTLSSISMYQQSIIRVSPITFSGERLSNFTSDVVTGENFYYVDSNINAKTEKNSVGVDYSVDSESIAGCSVYKKKYYDKYYTPLNYQFESAVKPGEDPTSEFFSPYRAIEALRAPGDSTAFQTILSYGDLITYRLRLFYKNGGDFFSNKSTTVLTVEPMQSIIIDIGTIATSVIKSKQIVSKFKISYQTVESSTSKILDLLRTLGNEEIFSQEINEIKSRLDDLVLFGVERTNISTSEVEFLGYHAAGEFIDDGSQGMRLRGGMKYRYCVTAYLTNTDQIEKSFNVSTMQNKSVISQTSDIRSPSNISKIQNAVLQTMEIAQTSNIGGTQLLSSATTRQKIDDYNILKLQKSITPTSLGKGIISDIARIDQDYDISTYNTGDSSYKILDLSNVTYSIKPMGNTTLTRSNAGSPVLRFSVTATGFSDISTIDQIVITCIRNNQKSICGACHNDGSGEFVFVDFTSKDYIGSISYFGTIITVDGKAIGEKLIAKSILRELYPNTLKVRT